MKTAILLIYVFFSLVFSISSKAQTWTTIGFYTYSGTRDLALDTSSGILYAAGSFPATGNVTPCIARRIGTTWDSLGSGMNGDVMSVIMFNGALYAGGYFTTAGGVAANYIARWDGTSWSPFGSGMDGAVFAFAVHNNELYAAGNFTTAGGIPASRIAKWDGFNWSPLGAGCDALVWTLVSYNGNLYAGGSFTNAGGLPANHIAKWDGINWSALGSGTNAGNSGVRCFAVHEGELYLGGYFIHVDGISANNIAKWNGLVFDSLGSGINGSVYEMESYNCELYIGGNFTIAGGLSSPKMAKYNQIGGWSIPSLPLPVNSIGSIDALKSSNGNLYVGGSIGTPNGNVQLWNLPVPSAPIAAFNATQTLTQYGNSIQFFSTGTDAVNFKWNFPGGVPSTSLEKNPKIFYPVVGDFDVSLIASNDIYSTNEFRNKYD
jgi:trimeric autotransporter adhesin